MSFPRYPEYKDSGDAALGQIPSHWRVARIGDVAKVVNGYPFDSALFHDDGAYPLIRIRDLGVSETATRYSGDFVETAAVTSSDVLIGMDGDFNVGRWLGTGAALLNQRMCCIRTPNTELTKLLEYALPQPLRVINDLTYATTVKHLSSSQIEKVRVALAPDRDELRTLVRFLDRETAKIDALVAEQEKLIALLQEKRQAAISHAVTKGLDPNVPMKDSGVEWLGEVPAHWEVLKGALIGNLFGSEQVPEDLVTDEGDLPFIKVGSMSSDSFEIESWNWFVDRTVADQYRAKTGYIVFPKRGAAIFLNKVNIVDRPSLIDPNLMGWEIGKNAIREFFAYALKSRKLDELADVSTVPQINNKHIAPERFPVPPVTEQRDIVTFLQAETGEIDSLTAEARSAITLLQERRTALISAAVTGQIDVRGMAGSSIAPDLIASSDYPVSA